MTSCTTIDEIEDLTGYDFLEALDDAEEESLEATTASTVWAVEST